MLRRATAAASCTSPANGCAAPPARNLRWCTTPVAAKRLPDVLGGRVQADIDALASMRGAIDGGQLKLLAVTTAKRIRTFPQVPTVAETVPGFQAVGWMALMAPPGTPAALARKISDDLRKVLVGSDLGQAPRRTWHLPQSDHARGADGLHPGAAADLASGHRRDRKIDQVASFDPAAAQHDVASASMEPQLSPFVPAQAGTQCHRC